MGSEPLSLSQVFDGWEGYQLSLVHAITPLSVEQLAWRNAPALRSVGEIARHISMGRIDWFRRMAAPGSAELAGQVPSWVQDQHGNRYVDDSQIDIALDATELVKWLEASWKMVAATLNQWTVDDLLKTYRHTYGGQVYAIPRQWTIWRIMAHDLHHGGQIAIMLGAQGIAIPELGDFGGHINMPPLAENS